MKSTPVVNNTIELNNRLNNTLFQYFYLFGITPDCLDISDFKENYKKTNFKKTQLLTQFPPYNNIQSYIDPDIIMNHCFPKGFTLLAKEKCPNDEYYYFSLKNLYMFWPENKKIYFTVVIIYESLKSYLDIKYKNKIPPLPKPNETKTESKTDTKTDTKTEAKADSKTETKNESISLEHIFVQKALCFSSFVPFPYQTKALIKDLLDYFRENQIILPMEKLIEGIIFGIPRPVRAYFYISCKKTNELIPKQKNDIDFCLKEFNKYNTYSYSYQFILNLTVQNILLVYKCLLLEIPLLFFSGKSKEFLTSVIEIFLNLLTPLEYQYPYAAILPDTYSGLIETEKSFVFGIHHTLRFKGKEKNQQHPTYFKDMNINIENKSIVICDLDNNKFYHYCNQNKLYNVIKFEDLGNDLDNSGGNGDSSQNNSATISGMTVNVSDITLPEKMTAKFTKDLTNYIFNHSEQIKNEEFSEELNKKIGEEFFYNYLASILFNYYNYIYNDEENIKKVINNEILNKKEEDINIEKLFFVSQFINSLSKSDINFYEKFFQTRIFKNFIIRKYLNFPFDRYSILLFDEKILEKKSKGFFTKKIKTEFCNSKLFAFNHIYQIKSASGFLGNETNYMKSNKDILLSQYYQNLGQYNKIKYNIFPKLIYDNKFFKDKKYAPNIEFSNHIVGCLKGYESIYNSMINEVNPNNFFCIYYKDPMNRYVVELNKIDLKNEALNSLNKVWIYLFCLTFYYLDETEKNFRFEELMRFLPKITDEQKQLFSILLLTIKEYGNETMLIKLFESIKNINFTEYCLFCSKFKGDSNTKWELKQIETTNVLLNRSYFRDTKNEDNKLLSEEKIDYDIKSLQKKTFSAKTTNSYKEKVSFELSYKCNNCGQSHEMTGLAINLKNKVKSSLMFCDGCKKFMEPNTNVTNGTEKIGFTIFSPIKMLNIVKEIIMIYGTKIDLDELRTKYISFYWNCILYFYLTGLSFEMLLKYKTKENMNLNIDKSKQKKKKKLFKKLIIDRQFNDI